MNSVLNFGRGLETNNISLSCIYLWAVENRNVQIYVVVIFYMFNLGLLFIVDKQEQATCTKIPAIF